MVAIARYITVDDPNRIVINGLSLTPGQRIIVTLTDADAADRTAWAADLSSVFRQIQAEAAGRDLTDEEIEAEIEAYRREKRE